MKLYVVNELNELDTNYNRCENTFLTEEEAKKTQEELVKAAFSDLGGFDKATICDNQVYNDEHTVTVNIDEVDMALRVFIYTEVFTSAEIPIEIKTDICIGEENALRKLNTSVEAWLKEKQKELGMDDKEFKDWIEEYQTEDCHKYQEFIYGLNEKVFSLTEHFV